jgi:ZIP family zinc transporter
VPRWRRLLLSARFAIPVLLATLVAFLTLRGRPQSWQCAALVGTAGLFAVAALEDMLQQAHEANDDARISTVALISGFATFVFVSAALGG